MSSHSSLTAERLREVVAYDAATGAFAWRNGRPIRGARAGVGGRRQVHIDGRAYYLRRLAWLYESGEWPEAQVDHINGDVDDNRIANLRIATTAENCQNRHRARVDNASGLMGVSIDRSGRYRARIMVDGKSRSLGFHDTAEAAHAAYREAKACLHPFWAQAA